MATLNVPNDFTAGTTSSASQVNANFTQVESIVNGSLSDDNLSVSAGVYSTYRVLTGVHSLFANDLVAGAYILDGTNAGVVASGGTPSRFTGIYLDDADYAITGKTAKLRIRGAVSTNATASGVTYTFGLYPHTVAGSFDAMAVTLGAAVSGSTAVVTTPAASTTVVATGTDFDVPADGLYVLGVTTTGTQANNSEGILHCWLQQHWA